MQIVSLLPSATEIVFELGIGDQLAGVSFECDYPAAARDLPVVAGTALETDSSSSAAAIDAEVSALVGTGEPIYRLDTARIRAIGPDLILAQDLCRVCAVPSGAVQDALDVIGCKAAVVALDPARLDDVISCRRRDQLHRTHRAGNGHGGGGRRPHVGSPPATDPRASPSRRSSEAAGVRPR
ncbi:MAG: hypothetical protein JO368_02340, partial [Acidimicrobiales bacterium]|nr:hypothetical protein [Acidimicrobiales bacterium]